MAGRTKSLSPAKSTRRTRASSSRIPRSLTTSPSSVNEPPPPPSPQSSPLREKSSTFIDSVLTPSKAAKHAVVSLDKEALIELNTLLHREDNWKIGVYEFICAHIGKFKDFVEPKEKNVRQMLKYFLTLASEKNYLKESDLDPKKSVVPVMAEKLGMEPSALKALMELDPIPAATAHGNIRHMLVLLAHKVKVEEHHRKMTFVAFVKETTKFVLRKRKAADAKDLFEFPKVDDDDEEEEEKVAPKRARRNSFDVGDLTERFRVASTCRHTGNRFCSCQVNTVGAVKERVDQMIEGDEDFALKVLDMLLNGLVKKEAAQEILRKYEAVFEDDADVEFEL